MASVIIDATLWDGTRAGARAGRGFRYQDAVAAWLAVEGWAGTQPWPTTIPEGVDDLTLHGLGAELRAQIKSRHDPQSTFSIAEIAEYIGKIAANLPADRDVDMALVLERRVEGLTATGWGTSLTSSGQNIDDLRDVLAANLDIDKSEADALLAKTHLIVEPDPISLGVACLEQKAGLTGAASRLCMQRLRELAGDTADRNYLAEAQHPVTFGQGEVQAAVDAISATIDPAGYYALTAGLCEVANFSEPLSAEGFYSGVDVQPGHVGAGLVFARPEPIAEALRAIRTNQAAIIAGPSGAGKSALAWLTAYETRHMVRWYRVRQIRADDVTRLAQIARLIDASDARPVGFVVDDLGREATQGWDELVREVRAQAGIYLIGTVREEDVFSLASASTLRIVRPLLDEDLAHRIWAALRKEDQTKAAYWKEAFEQSNQLLLEFTHLLTQGERLVDTIREQMRRRIAEHRDDEIEVLRPVAFAASHGATIREDRLRDRLGWSSSRFARAIARLENEHALRRRADGILTGLHEIRSVHIDEALRDTLGEPVDIALRQAVSDVSIPDFQTLIVRTLRRWPTGENSMLGAFADRLGETEPRALAGALHGLGLATCDRVAQAWLEISRSVELEDRLSAMGLMFALGRADFSGIPRFAKLAEAQGKFATLSIPDLRCGLPDSLITTTSCVDADDFHELLGALMSIGGAAGALSLPPISAAALDAAELPKTLDVLRTARELSAVFAQELADSVGGTAALLARLKQETAWITQPTMTQEGDDIVVASDVRLVSEQLQPDMHADVVRLCELLFGAAPSATVVASRALFADGRLYGINEHAMANKRMVRSALPAPANVSWNRALMRGVQRLLSGDSETGRQTALSFAVTDVTKMLRESAEMYCRGETPGARWQLMFKVRQILTELVPSEGIDESIPNALARGEYAGLDVAYSFANGVERLCQDLIAGSTEQLRFGAYHALDLAKNAKTLNVPNAWRLIDNPPFDALTEAHEILMDLRAVLGEANANADFKRRTIVALGKRSKHHPALPKAAENARACAAQRAQLRCRAIADAFAEQGQTVHVFSRSRDKDSGYAWPDVEFAALSETSDIATWMNGLPQLRSIMEAADVQQLVTAPIVEGFVIPLALAQIGTSLLPYAKFAREWSPHITFPVVSDPIIDRYDDALDAATSLSAAINGDANHLNEIETQFVGQLITRLQEQMAFFSEAMTADPDPDLLAAVQFLLDCFQRAFAEFDGRLEGERLAVVAHRATSGDPDMEFALGALVSRLTLIERTVRRRLAAV